ncbi:MAG: response regulator, partial [Deltaproteobacteria bacterium]
MNRRILLIDADPAFRASLAQQLGRYRFEVAAEADADQAFVLAVATPPALLMVAVEEPDKTGFKVFQRCKKGTLGKVPIVLVTSSVAPESFAKHRGLKIHADDYIDKRSLADGELLGKIDSLVGLGEPAVELDMPVEVDDIPLGHDDMVLEETVGEDDDGGGERVDSMVDAETDAAFAAILDDDALGGAGAAMAHAEPSPLPAPDDEAPAESLPPPAEARRPDEETSAVAAVPAPIHDTGRPQDSGAIDFDSFSRESMRPPVHLIARARQQHRDLVAPRSEDSVSAIPIDVEDLEQVDDDVEAGPAEATPVEAAPAETAPAETAPAEAAAAEAPASEAPAPEAPAPEAAAPAAPAAPREPAPAPPPGKPRLVEASPSADSLSLHGVVRDRQTGSYNTAPMPDLGLDEIAATETTTDHSGVFDRRALRRIGELERQIAQLKTELDRARATADASARNASREREFLNLREQITAKDRDVQRARDELRARDRDHADAQDR